MPQPPDGDLSKGGVAGWVDRSAAGERPLVDLGRVVHILWSRRIVIVASIAVAIACTLAYIAVTPSTYTARTVMLVDPREMRFTDADEVLSGIGSDSAAIASQVAVLRSRELLTAVLQQENLFSDPEFAAGSASNLNAAYDSFLRRLSVERQGLTYVIEVAFTSRDREKSARIANAIVDQYIRGQVGEKSRANADVTRMLEGQIDGLRKSVSEAEAAVEDFKVKNGMLDMGAGRTLLQMQVDQLNQQVLAARDRARQALNRYRQASDLQPLPNALITNGDILSSPTADQLRSEYNQRTVELSRLANVFGPRHPQLVAQSSQLEQLKALMEAETRRIVRRLEAELELANDDVAKAEMELATLRSQSDVTGQNEIELRQLQLQANSSREVLQQFMRRSKETGQLDNLQRSESRVISMAVPPTRTTWPRPSLMLAVAAFVGGVAGVLMALLLGEPAFVAKTLPPNGVGPWHRRLLHRLPRLAPSLPQAQITSLGRFTSNLTVPRGANGAYQRGSLTAAKLEVREAPTSTFSLQLWSMIGRLFDLLPQHRGPHLIAFSSHAGGAEACRLSFNTAAALERLGASVLMLDLNPLAYQMGRSMENDLMSAVSSPRPFNPKLMMDFATGLPLICAFSNPDRGANVDLDGPEAERLLRKAEDRFDFIIVHGLPWQDREGMKWVVEKSTYLVIVLNEAEDTRQQHAKLTAEVRPDAAVSYAVMVSTAPQQLKGHDDTALSSGVQFDSRLTRSG
ncbi:MAG: Wzz/FepE/Etk N-terminal domain-containing protein [Pseudorhizobium sp.]